MLAQPKEAGIEKRCSYVCIEAALLGLPMEKGVQLGLGAGPSRGPMSQPRRYHRYHVIYAGAYLRKALSVANFL